MKFETAAQWRHENRNEVQSLVRLVGSMCNLRAGARILRFGICHGPEQERSCPINTADGPTKGHKSLLCEDYRFWHSAAMRSVRDFSDHRQPARGYRARVGEIINFAKKRQLGEWNAA
jgi:hypothetical protein